MAALTAFLSALLGPIIRPIIQAEIDTAVGAIKDFITTQIDRSEIYKQYDQEAQQIINQIAAANTSEERWAYVEKLKASRAKLGI